MKTLVLFSSLVMVAISTFGQTYASPIHYIHVGMLRGTNATVLLCTPARLGEPVIVTNVASCELVGIILKRGTELAVKIAWKSSSGYSGHPTFAAYEGKVTLEKPVFPSEVCGQGFVGFPIFHHRHIDGLSQCCQREIVAGHPCQQERTRRAAGDSLTRQ